MHFANASLDRCLLLLLFCAEFAQTTCHLLFPLLVLRYLTFREEYLSLLVASHLLLISSCRNRPLLDLKIDGRDSFLNTLHENITVLWDIMIYVMAIMMISGASLDGTITNTCCRHGSLFSGLSRLGRLLV